jgi:hypothetical protein
MMPSQVAKQVQELFADYLGAGPDAIIGRARGTQLLGVLEMIAAIPDNLWISDDDYADMLIAKRTIEESISAWNAGRGVGGGIPSVKGQNVPRLLYQLLSRCPDEHSIPQHAELTFIGEEAVRVSIEVDVGGAYRALHHGEWKATNILAGAAIEALLYWRLAQWKKEARSKAQRAPSRKSFSEWNLADLIAVSQDLKILNDKQTTAAELTKG